MELNVVLQFCLAAPCYSLKRLYFFKNQVESFYFENVLLKEWKYDSIDSLLFR